VVSFLKVIMKKWVKHAQDVVQEFVNFIVTMKEGAWGCKGGEI